MVLFALMLGLFGLLESFITIFFLIFNLIFITILPAIDRTQMGRVVHCKVSWHTTIADITFRVPWMMYPLIHVYVTTLPMLRDVGVVLTALST